MIFHYIESYTVLGLSIPYLMVNYSCEHGGKEKFPLNDRFMEEWNDKKAIGKKRFRETERRRWEKRKTLFDMWKYGNTRGNGLKDFLSTLFYALVCGEIYNCRERLCFTNTYISEHASNPKYFKPICINLVITFICMRSNDWLHTFLL